MPKTRGLQALFSKVDLTENKPYRVILQFALPILISYLFQQVYSIADSAIVGQLIPDQFAGIADTGSITFIILQFAFGCTAGFSVITSKLFGKKDEQGVRKSFALTIWLSLVIATCLTVISIFLINPLLKWINVTPKYDIVTYKAASMYLFVIFLGMVTQIFYNLICSILRSIGDSFTPLLFLIISSVINVVLDFLFIYTFPSMEFELLKVAGCAIATVIAQATSAILCFIYTFRKYKFLRLRKEDFAASGKFIGEHLANGLPLAFQFSILAIGIIVMQGAINKFDIGTKTTYAQDGYGAACKIFNLFNAPFGSLGTAMISYTSLNLGAKKFDRIKKGLNQALLMSTIIYAGVLLISMLLTIKGAGVYIFLKKSHVTEDTIKYFNTYLYTSIPLFPLLYVLFLTRNTIQGLGKSIFPLIAGIGELGARVLFSVYAPVLISPQDPTSLAAYVSVCFSDAAAWIVADIVLLTGIIIYVYKGKMERDVLKKEEKLALEEQENSYPQEFNED